jgi:hypothetical protein
LKVQGLRSRVDGLGLRVESLGSEVRRETLMSESGTHLIYIYIHTYIYMYIYIYTYVYIYICSATGLEWCDSRRRLCNPQL